MLLKEVIFSGEVSVTLCIRMFEYALLLSPRTSFSGSIPLGRSWVLFHANIDWALIRSLPRRCCGTKNRSTERPGVSGVQGNHSIIYIQCTGMSSAPSEYKRWMSKFLL